MKRIGLSQRVENVQSYKERRDCLDQRWAELLGELDYLPIPIPNCLENVDSYLKANNFDGFILSGGNDLEIFEGGTNLAPERDKTESNILKFALNNDIPVLGVCRGMQMIGWHFQAKFKQVDNHVAKRHKLKIDIGSAELFKQKEVNSFHSFSIEEANDFKMIAESEDGELEAFKHNSKKITGIMWHPEREEPFSPDDLYLIKNIFN